MFFFKKLVSRFLFPLPLCLECLVLGSVLLLFTQKKKLGKIFLGLGITLVAVFGYPLAPDLMLKPLEQYYPPVVFKANTPSPTASSTYIGVLGQGSYLDSSIPANLRMNQDFVTRILEGVRLHRHLANSRLIISVAGEAMNDQEKLKLMSEFMRIMKVDETKVDIFTMARDTEDEVIAFKSKAGTNQCYMVSTSSHLPRAMILARRHELRAIPSPASYMVTPPEDAFSPAMLFPHAGNFLNAERAIYEYLGLAWEKIRFR